MGLWAYYLWVRFHIGGAGACPTKEDLLQSKTRFSRWYRYMYSLSKHRQKLLSITSCSPRYLTLVLHATYYSGMRRVSPRGATFYVGWLMEGATQKVQAWESHFHWTEEVSVEFCPSLFGPLIQDLFPRAFFVPCVSVSFGCCPGPLKYHVERWKMSPTSLLNWIRPPRGH